MNSNQPQKTYMLRDEQNHPVRSLVKGLLGGHQKLKIYGRLDCPSALRHLQKGHYKQQRVFFLNEEMAIKAGYRPCAVCMKDPYKKWKSNQQ